ncbi:MAG: hypothetical protein SFU27_02960, partial [Thermonemataceae bacterium]|nr:hypothetical protein [Thermonemataceae bacterium]
MKKLLLFCFVFLLATFLVSAQVSFESLEMGKSSKNWKNTENVSNPNSWEETAFILKDKVNFLGKEISGVKLEFYNDRLFRIGLELPAQDWEKLKAYLEKQYGKPWRIDEAKKEAAWGSAQKGFYTSANNNSILIYSADDSQKEFHWQDLFRGVLLYVILAIVGLFLVYFIIAWLLASYCPKCHSFSMELQEGVEFSN